MKLLQWVLLGMGAVLTLGLVGCAAPPSAAQGTLEFRANGEDFVRQGFTSKDGWSITFNHLYVTLDELTAYQSDPPFDPEEGGTPAATVSVVLDGPITVDLAEGGPDAEPVLIGAQSAPAGHYNALSWSMVPATEGPAEGYMLVIDGTATRADETVAFVLRLNEALTFTCGDFVGDTRKGLLAADDTADIEATFHFDHLFGDGAAPADDDINTGALGFDPLAALATDGTLQIDQTELEQQISADAYALLRSILPGLGHTGEGHCATEAQAATQ
ncbi:MAG: DUF4382 domain-containing protein [Chloroflexaceae bacterium]|nr:DUF4382 domain-containing protein [Chloroflexaceae bacterium]NJO06702.1 DUF4382 domain-containing protein [Chloroflexaceae bacterium]